MLEKNKSDLNAFENEQLEKTAFWLFFPATFKLHFKLRNIYTVNPLPPPNVGQFNSDLFSFFASRYFPFSKKM